MANSKQTDSSTDTRDISRSDVDVCNAAYFDKQTGDRIPLDDRPTDLTHCEEPLRGDPAVIDATTAARIKVSVSTQHEDIERIKTRVGNKLQSEMSVPVRLQTEIHNSGDRLSPGDYMLIYDWG